MKGLFLKSVLIFFMLFFLLIAVASGFSGIHLTVLLIGICFAPLFFFSPYLGLGIFFVSLPLFGNRPGTLQAISLTYISSVLLFSILGNFLFIKKIKTFPQNKVVFLSVLFLLFGFVSLIGLPLFELSRNFENFFVVGNITEIIFSISKLLSIDELQVYYPFFALLNAVIAFGIAFSAYVVVSSSKEKGLSLLICFFSGLMLSLFFGLLDYYHVIDLHFLRDLDPVVNAGDKQFRLQSFFGHSGWYAEYVTALIPLVILFLLLPFKYIYRVTFCILLMIVGEFVLILTYQRGGWLSYPLTLFVVWKAIYIFKIYESGKRESFFGLVRRSSFKILCSVPITIALSICLINQFSNVGENIISKYTQRFSEISKANDRTDFIKAGFLLGSLHPFVGGGNESFGFQYEREIASNEGRFYKKFNLPLHGSAHNFYAQVFSGKGLLGLFLILALIFSAIKDSFMILQKKNDLNNKSRAILLINISFLFAVLIYSNVQEFFYIQLLQIVFFSMLFIYAANFGEYLENIHIKFYGLIFCILMVCHIVWEFAVPGHNSEYLSEEFGCYSMEMTSDGERFRWCGRNAALRLPINRDEFGNAFLNLNLRTFELGNQKRFLVATINGQSIYQQELQGSSFYSNKVSLSNELVDNDMDTVLVALKTNAYFVPSVMLKNSNDKRVLSFQIIE